MNVFVGCSSRAPKTELYCHCCRIAESIADWIVDNGDNYVFGAGKTGLMGVIYNRIIERRKQQNQPEQNEAQNTTKVFGLTLERWANDLSQMECDLGIPLATLSDRKQMLFQMADVMVFLPGGLGTIDEIFSAIETKRSGEHNKDIIICNVDGYFDALLCMINSSARESFTQYFGEALYYVVSDGRELIEVLDQM